MVVSALDVIEESHKHQAKEALEPKPYELRAIDLFKSVDETRPHLATVWAYASDGGCSHVATNGHVIVLRRAGTHITTPMHMIASMTPTSLHNDWKQPPAWDHVLRVPKWLGEHPEKRGIDPSYFALVAKVEHAAGKRCAEDYAPAYGVSKKNEAMVRSALRDSARGVWTIGSDVYDGWYWCIDMPEEKDPYTLTKRAKQAPAILWQGIVMPRSVGER